MNIKGVKYKAGRVSVLLRMGTVKSWAWKKVIWSTPSIVKLLVIFAEEIIAVLRLSYPHRPLREVEGTGRTTRAMYGYH